MVLLLVLVFVLRRRLLAVTLLLLVVVVLAAAEAAAAAATAVPFAASCSRFMVLYFAAKLAAWRSPTSLLVSSPTARSCSENAVVWCFLCAALVFYWCWMS
jgi:hypothetical protein